MPDFFEAFRYQLLSYKALGIDPAEMQVRIFNHFLDKLPISLPHARDDLNDAVRDLTQRIMEGRD